MKIGVSELEIFFSFRYLMMLPKTKRVYRLLIGSKKGMNQQGTVNFLP